MCMLFVKPKGLTLPEVYLKSLEHNNADGITLFNLETGELIKTLNYPEAYDALDGMHDDDVVVHFRFGTSGDAKIEQLHGFEVVNGEYLLFHNGVLSTFKGNKVLSDTQQFVDAMNQLDGKMKTEELLGYMQWYLETYERSSRFLIVNRKTREVIKPNCAKWNDSILINDVPLEFSNSYAISALLLVDNCPLKTVKEFDYDEWMKEMDEKNRNKWKKATSTTLNNKVVGTVVADQTKAFVLDNISEDQSDNITFVGNFEFESDAELMDKFSILISNGDVDELTDFISNYADIVAMKLLAV